MQSTVVVGYDITEEGRAALDRGIEEARTRGANLYVVHDVWGQSGADTSEEVQQYTAEMARVEQTLSELGVRGEAHVRTVAQNIVESLAALAKELDPELFVIGLPRRSRVGKLLMGSTAQDLLLALDCPVLAVKAPESARF